VGEWGEWLVERFMRAVTSTRRRRGGDTVGMLGQVCAGREGLSCWVSGRSRLAGRAGVNGCVDDADA